VPATGPVTRPAGDPAADLAADPGNCRVTGEDRRRPPTGEMAGEMPGVGRNRWFLPCFCEGDFHFSRNRRRGFFFEPNPFAKIRRFCVFLSKGIFSRFFLNDIILFRFATLFWKSWKYPQITPMTQIRGCPVAVLAPIHETERTVLACL
jgi:hypothetical protein